MHNCMNMNIKKYQNDVNFILHNKSCKINNNLFFLFKSTHYTFQHEFNYFILLFNLIHNL
jgi:hypothetical protein